MSQLSVFGDNARPIGKYHGADPTSTEREAGVDVEEKNRGPLKPGKPGHQILRIYGDGRRRTAYDASLAATGDYHAARRESTRLLERGYLVKDGVLPNVAPRGRKHVDAFKITGSGLDELSRLDGTL